jgi:hypothetical protein
MKIKQCIVLALALLTLLSAAIASPPMPQDQGIIPKVQTSGTVSQKLFFSLTAATGIPWDFGSVWVTTVTPTDSSSVANALQAHSAGTSVPALYPVVRDRSGPAERWYWGTYNQQGKLVATGGMVGFSPPPATANQLLPPAGTPAYAALQQEVENYWRDDDPTMEITGMVEWSRVFLQPSDMPGFTYQGEPMTPEQVMMYYDSMAFGSSPPEETPGGRVPYETAKQYYDRSFNFGIDLVRGYGTDRPGIINHVSGGTIVPIILPYTFAQLTTEHSFAEFWQSLVPAALAEAGLTITRVVVGEPVTIKLRGNHRYEVTLQRSGAWFGKSFAGGPLRTAVVIGKTYLELTVTTTPGYPNLVFGGVVTGFDTMIGDALMTVYIAQGSGLTTKVLPLSELPAQASGQMRMLQPHLVSGRPSIAHRNRFETDLSGQWEVPNLQALFQLGYPDLLVARPPSTSLASATDTADDPAEVTSPAAATAPAQIVAQVEYGKRPAIEVCRPDYKGGVLTTLQATGMGDIANVGTPTPDRHFGVGRLREGVNHISVSAVDMTVTIPFWKAKHHVLHMVDPVTSPSGVPSRKRRMVLQVDPPDVLDRANLLAGYRVWSGEEFSVTVVTGGSEYFDMPRPVFDHIVFGSAPIAGAWTVAYWDEALAAMCRSDVPFGGEDPGAYVVTPRRGSTTFRFYCSDVRDIYCLTANLLGTAVNSLATRTLPVFRLLSHTINGYVQPVTS